jgi:transposase
MQGKKHYEERLFSTVNLSTMVPENHLLMRIDRVLDLSFIYKLTRDLYSSENGRPSIDPVLFFRMQLIGYLYGIASDRRLCEEIHLNLAYRWFCRLNLEDEVPDHSSLTRIRDRFGVETYQLIFEHLLKRLREKGLLKGKRIIADATLVEADAALDSLKERGDGDPKARALKQYERRYHDFREGKKRRKISNQTHVSGTDPDSTMVARPGRYRKLCYKIHYAIDGGNRFILDCHATTGARHECIVLPERISYLTEEHNFPIEEVIADRGYGRGPTYRHLREKRIRTYIPLHTDNLGEGRLSRSDFKYERRTDRYRCPGGHYLHPYEKLDKGIIKRYRIVGGHCRHCGLRNSCLPAGHKKRARFVYRSPHQDEIDKVKKRQQTTHFKKKLAERRWKIEGLFGEAKQNHCLRRAKYRGVHKVQIQSYMIAIAQNLKRLLGRFLDPFLRFWLALSTGFSPRRRPDTLMNQLACSGKAEHQPRPMFQWFWPTGGTGFSTASAFDLTAK